MNSRQTTAALFLLFSAVVLAEDPQEFTIRVVRPDGAAIGPGVRINAFPIESRLTPFAGTSHGPLFAIADDEGVCRGARPRRADYAIRARTSDQEWVGSGRLRPDVSEIVVSLKKATAVRGRLLDPTTGFPLKGREIEIVRTVNLNDSWNGSSREETVGRTLVNSRGEFSLNGLTVGDDFQLKIFQFAIGDEELRLHLFSKRFRTHDLHDHDLGDIVAYAPPGNDWERIQALLPVSSRSLKDQWRYTLSQRREDVRRTLVLLTSKYSKEHYALLPLFVHSGKEIHGDTDRRREQLDKTYQHAKALSAYTLLTADVGDAEERRRVTAAAKELDLDLPSSDGKAALFVLDSAGKLLARASFEDLSRGGKADVERFTEFLLRHSE